MFPCSLSALLLLWIHRTHTFVLSCLNTACRNQDFSQHAEYPSVTSDELFRPAFSSP